MTFLPADWLLGRFCVKLKGISTHSYPCALQLDEQECSRDNPALDALAELLDAELAPAHRQVGTAGNGVPPMSTA